MHVYEAGRTGAPTLVLLHAILTTGAMWRRQVQALAGHTSPACHSGAASR